MRSHRQRNFAESVGKSYGQNVLGACRSGNLGAFWWTPTVKEAAKLKKEAFGLDWFRHLPDRY